MSIARMGRVGFVALVIAALALGGAQQPKPQASAEQSQAAQIEHGSAQIADAIRQTRPENDNGCGDRKDKRGSDLCAQWGAVDAARNAAKATWAAVFLTFFGTFLIFLTFLEQRKTSRAELRAYVFPELVTLHDGTDPVLRPDLANCPSVEIAIKNFGKTPARNLKHAGTFVIADNNFDDAPERSDGDRFKNMIGSTLPPGHNQTALYVLTGTPYEHDGRLCLSPSAIEEMKQSAVVLLALGRIEFCDVFGKRHVTEYRFFHTNHWPPHDGKTGMRIADRGNRDT